MERGMHVLLADDESGFRFSASIALRAAGYRVTAAGDGREALERVIEARAAGDPVRILVTDQQMPEMTGFELILALRERGIDVPVVVVTGWTVPRSAPSVPCEEFRELIEKPIVPADLVACLERILGTSREGKFGSSPEPLRTSPVAGGVRRKLPPRDR